MVILSRSVVTVHVCRRVRFRIAQGLGIRQHVGKGCTLAGHAGEDVVGGAIDDSSNPLNPIGPQGLLEGLDDGNATPHGSLHQNVDTSPGRGRVDFHPMVGNNGLVGGDHRLAHGDGLQDQAAGRLQAPQHLHHHVNGGIIHHSLQLIGEATGWEGNGAAPLQVAHPDFPQLELSHEGLASLRVQQDPGHPCSHGPESKKSDAKAHALSI